ncbi:MAG: 30S ribosome-binding factor RbfA [Hyphomicrobiaceae bacterium]|nr:30S ribosome-binding factor RbfA [Hyphomicrobiaceae bacterium]
MTRKASHSEPSQRMLRVGELIRHELAALFARDEIMDEELYGITITVPEVRVSPDLKLASAYIMPLGGVHAGEVVKALNRNKKFIRGRIVPHLGLKYAPELRFLVDETFEEADRIDTLLRSERVQRDLHPDDDAEEE